MKAVIIGVSFLFYCHLNSFKLSAQDRKSTRHLVKPANHGTVENTKATEEPKSKPETKPKYEKLGTGVVFHKQITVDYKNAEIECETQAAKLFAEFIKRIDPNEIQANCTRLCVDTRELSTVYPLSSNYDLSIICEPRAPALASQLRIQFKIEALIDRLIEKGTATGEDIVQLKAAADLGAQSVAAIEVPATKIQATSEIKCKIKWAKTGVCK